MDTNNDTNKDTNNDTNNDTNKDTKQAPTSVATTSTTTSASTPGVVHVDASSMKGQQAFQKTTVEEEQEGQHIEEVTRRRVIEVLGQVGDAKVVEENDLSKTRPQNDGSNNRRGRALLCTAIMVILLGTILGSVLATRDESESTVAPLNNSLCEEAHLITLGGAALVASLENAVEQVVAFCEFPDQSDGSQPGLWYKVRGDRGG